MGFPVSVVLAETVKQTIKKWATSSSYLHVYENLTTVTLRWRNVHEIDDFHEHFKRQNVQNVDI